MSHAVAVGALAVPSPTPIPFLNSTAPVELEHGHGHGVKLIQDGYKWRIVLAYDGTQYAGWQYQESPPTVQCTVEKALTQATKLQRKDLCLVGASRTDAGVHAWGQVAHFFTPFNYDNLEQLHAALNGLLPTDIRIREISPASAEFHARFSAKSKIYHYKIYNDAIMDPFQRHFAYHSVYKLNSAVMREAATYFVGKHDFSAFANASHNDRVPDPVKHVFRFDLKEMGALLQLEVEGSGFLYRWLCCFRLVGKLSLLTLYHIFWRVEIAKSLQNTPCLPLHMVFVLFLSTIMKVTYCLRRSPPLQTVLVDIRP
ncbi:hypothetical protein GLYMA_13G119200v4 [Glycine max]|uniref:tRNA pseudouridine synthase n=1 Tax=Glycine max TaxID=3847 RepID=A0A0R0GUD8_SOYBN|nr:hypothetical protein GYH30_035921 [Glycine max]KRH19491.1 hypothetical protein GLYMA_13G119200v4 [Glycine max]